MSDLPALSSRKLANSASDSTRRRGAEVKVFNDQPSDIDMFQAELRNLRSFPHVAKYPVIFYALDVDMWYDVRIEKASKSPAGGAMSDPDVLRLTGLLRQRRLQERIDAIDRNYEEKIREIRASG